MVTKAKKLTIIAAAIVVICLCGFTINKTLTPLFEEEETIEYSYNMSVYSEYKVNLNENGLYSQGIMEENMIYPKSIFGWLEINFFAEFLGTSNSDIRADYDVEVRVRGYQIKSEEKRIIYEKSFPLISQTNLNFSNEAHISQPIYLDFNEYENYIHNAEAILMASPSSEAEIIFKGNITADTEFGEIEEKFNYSIPLPLLQNLFTIDKPQPIEKKGSITDTQIKEVPPEKNKLILPVAVIVIMLSVIVYTIKFTVPPDEGKIRELKFKSIVKKYGSRIVRVSERVSINSEVRMIINDMESMIKISDQLNIPVFYILDSEGMPLDNSFFIPEEEMMYIYYML